MKELLSTILILSFMLLACCCGQIQHHNSVSINPAFQQYVDRFQAASNEVGQPVEIDDLNIIFANDPVLPQVAFCQVTSNETPEIHVLPSYWNNASDLQREQLMFHELGHCVLGLQHTAVIELTNTGRSLPVSIMNPLLFNNGIYAANRSEYIKQLFNSTYVPELQ